MATELKRAESLRRIKIWVNSETNRQPETPRETSKRDVKFPRGCEFLAACSSGDTEEVKRLLETGVDINTSNVDGLTALHQACIDGNLDMVEFLVDAQADIDACDNEGWTPLHATASCGYTEIARHLMKHGANVAVVNNDGDLAVDVADDEEMENLLQEEMERNDVDAEAKKREEEDLMLADANTWLLNGKVEEKIHPDTGATALHVAAAKGYINVMNVLLQSSVDINAQDFDGWTPLHAAVHWNQEDACQILVDHLCDMGLKNHAGHTVFDLAESDDSEEMLTFLEDLQKKQVSLRGDEDSSNDIIHSHGLGSRRRSSVTRMSSDQKQNVIAKTVEEERATRDARLSHLSSVKDEEQESKTPNTPSAQDAETERKNEHNKQSSLISQPQNSSSNHNSIPDSYELALSWRRSLRKTISTSTVNDQMNENDNASVPRSASSPRIALDNSIESLQDRLNARYPSTTSSTSSPTTSTTTSTSTSTSLTPGTSFTSTSESRHDRNSWSGDTSSYAPYRDYLSRSGYKPFYQRQQEINQKKEQERAALGVRSVTRPASTIGTSFPTYSSSLSSSSTATTSVTSTTTSVTNPASSTSTSSVFRRSYEPPKRDEETETQRKARAKHARQTRRSTQGINAEDVEKAEKAVSQGDSSKNTATETVPSSSSSSDTSIRDSTKDVTSSSTTAATTTTSATDTVSSSSSSLTSSALLTSDKERTNNLFSRDSFRRRNWDGDSSIRSSYRRLQEDQGLTTNGIPASLSSSLSSSTSLSYVPRSQRNALSTSDIGSSSTTTTTTSGGFSGSGLSSPGLSRTSSFRSRLHHEEKAPSSSSAAAAAAADSEGKKQETKASRRAESSSTEPPPTEKKEMAACRAKRKRNERRLTDKVHILPEDLDIDKENQPDEEKDESSENSSRLGRYSASDVPGDSTIRSRPASYTRSTTSLDEYKKMYEDEKEQNGKLRKELEHCKKDLLEAKAELDKLMKNNDTSRSSDSSDKRERRALERKVSEYEEELKQLEKIKAENKKLKEENRALTRVVSKLSK